VSRIFITGVTGNVGQPVLREFISQGYDVVALLRRPAEIPGCRVVIGSLEKAFQLQKEIMAADAIIHLASPRHSTRHSVIYYDIRGTGKLLDAWQRGHFVYMSSQTVYGFPRRLLVETESLQSSSWYDWGKICNEFQVQTAASLRGSNCQAGISLRMGLLYGSGTRRNDRQFLPWIYRLCMSGVSVVFDSEEGLETYGSSFIGEADLARAVAGSLKITHSGCFNVAAGYCTWKLLIETFCRFTGKRPKFVVRSGASCGPLEYRLPQSVSLLDTNSFNGQTGFVSRQAVDELVEQFVAVERLS
jgi:nucleoside-diphosphate-sugar epimerase